MRKIVLDTNILVSAFLSPSGNPSLILNTTFDGKLLFFYTRAIFGEYEDVLMRPDFGFDRARVRFQLDTLLEIGTENNPPKSDISLPDKSDQKFYDLARFTGAYLVTGNLKHYPNESFIISPAKMAQKITSDLE